MASQPLPMQWTPAATNDLKNFTPADFGGTNPKDFHEQKVQGYYDANKTGSLQGTVKAKIRRGAHSGGNDPKEADHITVSFKDSRNKDVGGGGVHVYTGR